MLGLIAWRNVWRSPGRSITIMMAIIIGVASFSFLMGFINAVIESFVNNSINAEHSHVQMHHPEFKKDHEIKFVISEGGEVIKQLQVDSAVKAVTQRTVVNGMISSSKTGSGTTIYGIDVAEEANVTRLDSAVVEGTYFEGINRNPLLISVKMAEKLKLKLRSKVVLTLQNKEGEITAGAFRIAGIFESLSPKINETVVYARQSDIGALLGNGNRMHEIAILLNKLEDEPAFTAKMVEKYPDTLVESWNELAPELEMMQSQVWINMSVVLFIILGALAFGIINTMLMAVLERVKELGMLKAVGMKKGRIFSMILLETLMMVLVSVPVGIAIATWINHSFQDTGLDLSAWSEGLKDIGYPLVLYPKVMFTDYLTIGLGVGLTAIIAAIYPAMKAIKLKTIEALHTI